MEVSKLMKIRGDNWSQKEKGLFLDIIKKSVNIIENKCTETNSLKAKQDEWRRIQKSHNELSGNLRSVAQLKGAWRRYKLTAKKGISLHRKAICEAGGGDKPPSPPEEMKIVVEICPTDFVDEDNKFDSDSIFNTPINMNNDVNHSIDKDPFSSSNVYTESMGDISEIKDKEQKDNKKPPKNTILETNMEFKKKAQSLLEEEHQIKIKYHKKELEHQADKQKLELEILQLEKYKRELEIAKLMMDN